MGECWRSSPAIITPLPHIRGWAPEPSGLKNTTLPMSGLHTASARPPFLDPTSLLSPAEQKEVQWLREVGPGSSSSLPDDPSPVLVGVKGHWTFQQLHRTQVDLLGVDRHPTGVGGEYYC